MSTKMLDLSPPPPPCPHLEMIYTVKFIQPLLLRPLFHDPPTMRTSYLDAPKRSKLTSDDLDAPPHYSTYLQLLFRLPCGRRHARLIGGEHGLGRRVLRRRHRPDGQRRRDGLRYANREGRHSNSKKGSRSRYLWGQRWLPNVPKSRLDQD